MKIEYLLIIAMVLIVGCATVQAPTFNCPGREDEKVFTKISNDYFADNQNGQPHYYVQRRGYKDNCAVTLNQWDLNREEWEKGGD